MGSDLFVFAGETSGDLHGEKLLKALKQLDPSLTVTGVGGPRMRSVGMHCVLPMEEFQVMGFVDVFLALPKLMRQFYFIARTILKQQPAAVLFIDYPGFNLRMAKFLRKKGFTGKLCHFISPSVWAWRKKRIPLMGRSLDLLLTILPFEKRYFAKEALHVEYVGHPLVQRLKEHVYEKLPVPQGKRVIALFPGSRKKELERNFPLHLKVCKRLQQLHPDLFFAVSVSEERFRPWIVERIAQEGLEMALIPAASTYDLMREAYAAIAKSGTVTLELALHAVPTVVTYAISSLDLIIARDLVRIRLPYYCLVNIIGSKEIFPELFGPHFTEDTLFIESERMVGDEKHWKQCQSACQALAQELGNTDACLEAAKHLLQKLYTQND